MGCWVQAGALSLGVLTTDRSQQVGPGGGYRFRGLGQSWSWVSVPRPWGQGHSGHSLPICPLALRSALGLQGEAKVGLGDSLTSWGPGSAVNILSHCGVEGRPVILHPQDSLPLHPATILLLRTASCVGDWTHTTHSGLSSVPLPKRLLSKTSFPVSGATLLPGSFSA